MDPAAIAELTVEMYSLIDAKLIARKFTDLDPEIKAMMLKEAMALYMTNIINKAKYPSTSPGGATERHDDTEAPRPASQKQLKYIDDLGGDSSEIHTAAEASAEITRLKK